MDCRRSLRGTQAGKTMDSMLDSFPSADLGLYEQGTFHNRLARPKPRAKTDRIVAEVNTMINSMLVSFRPTTSCSDAEHPVTVDACVDALATKRQAEDEAIKTLVARGDKLAPHPAVRGPVEPAASNTALIHDTAVSEPKCIVDEVHHSEKRPRILQRAKVFMDRVVGDRVMECAYCCELRPLREDFPRSWQVPRQCWKHLVPASTSLSPRSHGHHFGMAAYPCRACLARALAAQVQLRRHCGDGAILRVGCPVCRAVWSDGTLLRNMETKDYRKLMDIRAASRIVDPASRGGPVMVG